MQTPIQSTQSAKLMWNKKVRILVFTGAFIGMGMTMPSCPGQQAMQQQIDSLQNGSIEINKKIATLDSQLKASNAEIATLKQSMETETKNTQAQFEQVVGTMKTMDTRITTLSTKAAAKPAKRHR